MKVHFYLHFKTHSDSIYVSKHHGIHYMRSIIQHYRIWQATKCPGVRSTSGGSI